MDIKELFGRIKPPLFDNLGDTVPQQGDRTTTPAPAPTGWVMNSDANVIIDANGLLIRNGKLQLEDSDGRTVMTAAGFQGPWLDFLSDGLYNSSFVFGSGTGPIVPVTLPYWSVAVFGGSTVTASVGLDSLAAGGRAVFFTNPTLNATAQASQIGQGWMPVKRDTGLALGFNWRSSANAATVAKPFQLVVVVYYYSSTGAVISTVAKSLLKSAPVTSYSQLDFDMGDVPDAAASCYIYVGVQWPNGSPAAGSYVAFRNVSLRRAARGMRYVSSGFSVLENVLKTDADNGAVTVEMTQLPDHAVKMVTGNMILQGLDSGINNSFRIVDPTTGADIVNLYTLGSSLAYRAVPFTVPTHSAFNRCIRYSTTCGAGQSIRVFLRIRGYWTDDLHGG